MILLGKQLKIKNVILWLNNDVVESFFKFLKKEETNRRNYQSVKELDISLFEYIEGFYNSIRSHSYNGGLSPNQKEAKYMKG